MATKEKHTIAIKINSIKTIFLSSFYFAADIPTVIPRYLEDAVLYEGSIDMQNVNEYEATRNELYATINTVTLATEEDYLNNNNNNNNYETEEVYLTDTTTTINTNPNFDSPDVLRKSENLKSFFTKSYPSPSVYCPVRFDGYLCWPRTPAGTVLSQYCPDFVEGFNSKFLAHKT